MVVRYVVGKPETVDASTFRRFLGHLAFNVPPRASRAERGVYLPLMVPQRGYGKFNP
jgi:hypothetical protein